MEPDQLKQPSKHPSSNQSKKHHHHHRPSTAAAPSTSSSVVAASTDDDNFVAALKRREKGGSGGGTSVAGSGSKGSKPGKQTNHSFEMKPDNNLASSRITSSRSKPREVGKVKPIRIVPPNNDTGGIMEIRNAREEEGETKLKLRHSLMRAATTTGNTTMAWEDQEICGDNHERKKKGMKSEEEGEFGEEEGERLDKEETPEKMFINTCELGPTKYYRDGKEKGREKGVGMDKVIYKAGDEDNGEEEDEDLLSSCENLKSDNNNKSSNSSSSLNNNRNNNEVLRGEEVEEAQKGKSGEEKGVGVSTRAASAPVTSGVAVGRSTASACSERVKVIVRCRPMSQREVDQGHEWLVDIEQEIIFYRFGGFYNEIMRCFLQCRVC